MAVTRRSLLAALALAALPLLSAAQQDGAAPGAAERHRALVESLPRGPAFESGGERYQPVEGIRAVVRRPGESFDDALARAGAAPSDLVEPKGRFLLFRQGPAAPGAARPAASPGRTCPVAVNARTGKLGVVLGSIVARLRHVMDARAVAADHGLAVAFVAPQLSTAFYRVAPGQDAQAAAAALARDGRVEWAEVEVKEHVAEPR